MLRIPSPRLAPLGLLLAGLLGGDAKRAAPAPTAAQARFRAFVKAVDGRGSVVLDETVTLPAGGSGQSFTRELDTPPEARTLRLETTGTSGTSFWARRPSRAGEAGPAAA